MPKVFNSRLLAFTLVEILVVVSIIGILLTFSFAGLQGARSSARDAQRKSDLEDIRSALEVYRSDCGFYPSAPLPWGSSLVGSGASGCPITNVYMSKIPQDPQNVSKGLVYEYVLGSGSYTLCTSLEHGSATPAPCAGSSGKNCGTTGCNFSRTNP